MGKEDETLRGLLDEQKKLLKKYETIVEAYEKRDILQENTRLQEEVAHLRKANKELCEEQSKLKEEAQAVKAALREQIISERLDIICKDEEKRRTYFRNECKETLDTLTANELKIKEMIDRLNKEAREELKEDAKRYLSELEQIRISIQEEIKEKEYIYRRQQAELENDIQGAYQKIKEQPVSKEVMEKRIKANNMEVKIGLNWINKAGILLILIGIITVMRYSFENFFTNELKGIFGLAAGIAFLLAGEYGARKEKKIFSQGMIGGGIGILYITVFCSYFILDILSIPIALLLAVLISATAFVLCLRYQSKTIGCLALIGGYMPLIACGLIDEGLVGVLVYMSMGYVLILNGVTLLISRKKNWSVLEYLSYGTNIPVAIYLAFSAENPLIGIGYSIVTFMIYNAIMLVGPLKDGQLFTIGKEIVMALNTVISCSVVFVLFIIAKFNDWMGILALIFCVAYYVLAKMVEEKAKGEKRLPIVFNITALTFAILVIPLQFDLKYITLGWLIEGILLLLYGISSASKKLEYAGRIVFGLCLTFFYCGIGLLFMEESLTSEIKYLSVILGTIGVMILYIWVYRDEIENRTIKRIGFTSYKYFTIGTLWFYLLRMGGKLVDRVEVLSGSNMPMDILVFSLVTAILLTLLRKVKWLYDSYRHYVIIAGFCLIDLIGIVSNAEPYTLCGSAAEGKIIAIIVMLLWNVLILLNLSSLIKEIIVRGEWNTEVYPLALAIAIITNMTMILGIQFELGISSVIISILYVVGAFIAIGIGFKLAYRWIRYFGLGLSLFALGKLFLFDFTIGVSIGYKIISYFGFGIVLLIISYVYQKFSKMMESYVPDLVKEAKADEESNRLSVTTDDRDE